MCFFHYKLWTCGSVWFQRLHDDPVIKCKLLSAAKPEDAPRRPPLGAGVLDPPRLHEGRVRRNGVALADGDILQEHHAGQTGVDSLKVKVGADCGLDVPLVHVEVEHGGVVVDARPHQPQHLVDKLLPILGLEAAQLRHHVVNFHH